MLLIHTFVLMFPITAFAIDRVVDKKLKWRLIHSLLGILNQL
jgi:hypothetical protein